MKNPHRGKRVFHRGRWLVCFFSVALWCLFCNAPVSAHKVTIFAWVEGNTVHTQSKFSGGKVAKNSTVVVYDKDGAQLLEGKTDETGAFSFKVPQKAELKVVLKASMGHLAEWIISAEEITAVNSGSESSSHEKKEDEVLARHNIAVSEAQVDDGESVATVDGLTKKDIQELIDASVDKKLAPLMNRLADSVDSGPRAFDVIGGVGYIFGLVGVALYFSNRGKKGA